MTYNERKILTEIYVLKFFDNIFDGKDIEIYKENNEKIIKSTDIYIKNQYDDYFHKENRDLFKKVQKTMTSLIRACDDAGGGIDKRTIERSTLMDFLEILIWNNLGFEYFDERNN